MKSIYGYLKQGAKKEINKVIYAKKQKIFCIGKNKTGTTSLTKAMKELGFKVGNQREAELLFDDWVKRDFSRLINPKLSIGLTFLMTANRIRCS